MLFMSKSGSAGRGFQKDEGTPAEGRGAHAAKGDAPVDVYKRQAQDWAEMLYRMYCRWGERHNFKVKTLDYLDGEMCIRDRAESSRAQKYNGGVWPHPYNQ